MLRWAITFLCLALIAAVLGFSGIAGAAAGMAKILFYVFIAFMVISFFFGKKKTVWNYDKKPSQFHIIAIWYTSNTVEPRN